MVKARLKNAIFHTAKDKILHNNFIQKVLSNLPKREGVSDSWSKNVIIALIIS